MDLGERVKKLRKKHKMTQAELALGLNVSTQTIINYENGIRAISLDKLKQIADFFSFPLHFFFIENFENALEPKQSITKCYENENMKKIPIVSRVSAGHGSWRDEEIDNFIELPINLFKKCDFATIVDGDSMMPEIRNGEIVFIKQVDFLENGNIGIFNLNGEVFIKKYFENAITDERALIPLNHNYPTIKIKDEDNFKIIGRVIGSLNYSL